MPDETDQSDLNLSSILGKEKKQLSLLDPDFYEKAARLVEGLEDEKKRVPGDSTKEDQVTDMLDSSKKQITEIIKVRMHNIVRYAEAEAGKKRPGEAPALIREELVFYNAVFNLMTTFRRDSLGRVFGEGGIKTIVPKETKEAANKTGGTKTKDRDISGYIMVRLLTNVPTFVGMDNRNYTLAKEDVTMVPAVNAHALIKRKVAVKIAANKNKS